MRKQLLSVLIIVLFAFTSFIVDAQSATAEPVIGSRILEVQGAEDGQTYLLEVTCEIPTGYDAKGISLASYAEDEKAELKAQGCKIVKNSVYAGAGNFRTIETAYCPKCSITSLKTE